MDGPHHGIAGSQGLPVVLDSETSSVVNWLRQRGIHPLEGGAVANIEDHMVAVAILIEERGGEMRAEPGQLIREIAEAVFDVEIETPYHRYPQYHAVSRALIELEETGMVYIERAGWHKSERANRLVAVRLI